MTLRLVSEARPIKWTQLSTIEKKLLEEADKWIRDVIQDGEAKRPAPNAIERDRTGRVLLIDGQRGAGKTSFLLTLLDRWKEKKTESRVGAKIEGVEVLLPILDFDPLPHGMPLHGWLLEPWRKQALAYEKEHTNPTGGKDLTELWNEVFERAVIGWTSAATPGKGVVERAIQYQEQASGWIDTREVWHNLVNAMVCTSLRCSDDPKKCEKELHPVVFVIAIDDVDLQVEHLPQLLHAIRLLHHPNVAYVLTGDLGHLELALELDYLGRHADLARSWIGVRGVRQDENDALWPQVRESSVKLRNALIQKALPEHARLLLPTLTAGTVLKLVVGDNVEVAEYLTKEWGGVLQSADGLSLVTARQAQHAIDRALARARQRDDVPSREFVADLCGTTIETTRAPDGKGKKSRKQPVDDPQKRQFLLYGQLTTRLGKTLRSWEADQVKVVLSDQPRFAFLPDFEEVGIRFDEEAHRAAVVQIAVEKGLASAHALNWFAEAGIATTQVSWSPATNKVPRTAVFHWPWLKRPTVTQVVELYDLPRRMSEQAPDTSLDDLPATMIETWLLRTVNWFRSGTPKGDALSNDSFGDLGRALKELTTRNRDLKNKEEVELWARDLLIMTAPYYGLPVKIRDALRAVIGKHVKDRNDLGELQKAEMKVVRNAIFQARNLGSGRLLGHARSRHRSVQGSARPESDVELTDSELDSEADKFLQEMKAKEWLAEWQNGKAT